MTQRLIVLLPVRNAAPDLPGLFDCLRPLCDGVVALDDGSTDDTGQLLKAEPLVGEVLTNPIRMSYAGWDDASNRNRLLAAAGRFAPDWILSLDADERIDDADAAALRRFLETDALPGCAYGFRHVPMRQTGGWYLPDEQWVYRLFAWEPGQRFADQRLHFVPVPTDLPRALWVRTTLRIQHLGGQTGARRLERFAKYVEADPARFFRADYDRLLMGPRIEDLRRWEPRPAGQPVLLSEAEVPDHRPIAEPEALDHDQDPDQPGTDEVSLSVVVISFNDERTIERTVAAIAGQVVSDPFEVIVVTSGTDRTAAIVRQRFPQVRLVELPRRALPGEARNAGLRVASGTYISFPGSHVELPPGSLQARLDAHRRGYPMVTGVAVNGNRTAAGWASYFIDHHAGLPGHRPARIDGPPAHCSYARRPLVAAGGFPEGVRSAEDTRVNQLLVSRGYVAFRDPAIRFTHSSPCRTVRKLISHHLTRGRGWGRLAVANAPAAAPLIDRAFLRQRLLGHIPGWMRRIDRGVARADPELAARYGPVRRLVLAGVVAGWAGMWFEILRPGPGQVARLTGYREMTLLAVPDSDGSSVALLRLDLTTRYAQLLTLQPAPQKDGMVHEPTRPRPTRSDRIGAIESALGLRADVVLQRPRAIAPADAAPAGVRFWRLIPRVVLGSGSRGRVPVLRKLIAVAALTRQFTVVQSTATLPTPQPGGGTRRPRTRVPGRMSQ